MLAETPPTAVTADGAKHRTRNEVSSDAPPTVHPDRARQRMDTLLMIVKAIVGMYAAGAILAAAGQEVTVALIGGAVTLLNTTLLVALNRKANDVQSKAADIHADQQATKTALTAPRRIIYDQDGNPIGTVLDLHRDGGWDDWLAQHNRRVDDPPPA